LRQLAKPCMLAAMTAAPLRGFLVFGFCFVIFFNYYFFVFVSFFVGSGFVVRDVMIIYTRNILCTKTMAL